MNNKIKELTKLALEQIKNDTSDPVIVVDRVGHQGMASNGVLEIPLSFSQKLAELVVQDCVNIINNRADTSADYLDSKNANDHARQVQRDCATTLEYAYGLKEMKMVKDLDTTIEKMRTLVSGLDRISEASKGLTEEQVQSLMARPEFAKLLQTHEALSEAFDRELGPQ